MLREGHSNFFVERENFGKQVSVNFNKLLKQKFHFSEGRFSLVDLISITQEELAKSSVRYQQGNAHVEISTRQNEFIKKRYDLFVKSESKDVAQFFATLTFKDNNGSVKEMENYIIGDENEVAEDDDGDYEIVEHARQGNDAQDDILQQGIQQGIQQQQEGIPMCVVCLAGRITTMLEPCNHLKFCRDCVEILIVTELNEFGEELIPKCPLCRTVITGYRFVYF